MAVVEEAKLHILPWTGRVDNNVEGRNKSSKFPKEPQVGHRLLGSLEMGNLAVMPNSDFRLGIDSGITEFIAGIGIKKTKRYWNRNWNQRI